MSWFDHNRGSSQNKELKVVVESKIDLSCQDIFRYLGLSRSSVTQQLHLVFIVSVMAVKSLSDKLTSHQFDCTNDMNTVDQRAAEQEHLVVCSASSLFLQGLGIKPPFDLLRKITAVARHVNQSAAFTHIHTLLALSGLTD